LSSRFSVDDTIVAVASPQGGGARGIVRISGPAAWDCAAVLFRPSAGQVIGNQQVGNQQDRPMTGRPRASPAVSGQEPAFPRPPRPAVISGQLHLPDLYSALPCDAYLWPAGRGYTRQEAVELHTLGSPPLLELIVDRVCQAGARPAEPGEFTLRAFLAGRLDLTQAEAVLGVINAPDRRRLDVALAQLAGGLGRPLARLREALLELLAHIEAGLDFVDEDISFIALEETQRQLAQAADQVEQARRQLAARGEARPTTRAVLIGRPNVGKSSLFNALAGQYQAIVSPTAGTTRDYLAVDLNLDGIPCQLIDTAGAQLTGADDVISTASGAFRDEQSTAAHIRVYCLDATREPDDLERAWLTASDETHRIVAWTKCDRPVAASDLTPDPTSDPTSGRAKSQIMTSALTGAGLPALRKRLRDLCGEMDHLGVAATAERCAESLRLAAESLDRARELASSPGVEELVAAELRVALDGLGQVVGQVYTDDILDRVFSRFCIGK
jgi:tRNA modification GTPase